MSGGVSCNGRTASVRKHPKILASSLSMCDGSFWQILNGLDRSWVEKMSSCNCMLLRDNEKMVVKYLIDKLLALALDLAL